MYILTLSPLLIYEGRSKILQVHFYLTPSAQTGEKSHHVSINVTLIISTLIAGSRFTGGQK